SRHADRRTDTIISGGAAFSGFALAQAPNQVVASGPVILYKGQTDYSESGNWTSCKGGGHNENVRFAGGNGSRTTTWELTGFYVDTYDVQLIWLPNVSKNKSMSGPLTSAY